MKNLIALLFLSILLFGCEKYEDYTIDFDNTAVYFPQTGQVNTRSFVVNEDDNIQVGVVLGGKRENNELETANYIIDPNMITEPDQVLLPQSYYSIDNEFQFEIMPGSFQGNVEITIKPEFYEDPLAISANYVLPFKLVDTSLDSILAGRDSLILHLKYEAEVFGNYYHNGATTISGGASTGSDTTIVYYQEEPVTNAVNNWTLTTISKDMVKTNGIAYLLDGSTANSFFIKVDETHNVSVISDPASSIAITKSGTCSYDVEEGLIYLDYSFTNAGGKDCHALDTLAFRNRMLDGVNQWRGL